MELWAFKRYLASEIDFHLDSVVVKRGSRAMIGGLHRRADNGSSYQFGCDMNTDFRLSTRQRLEIPQVAPTTGL